MLLTVDVAPDIFTATSFTFIVPGNQLWRLRSVLATVTTTTAGGGIRTYVLQVTDGTNLVAQVGANDGIGPAEGAITWANTPAATSAIDGHFTSVAPIPGLTLRPGYNIIGTIVNPDPGDQFNTAAAWYEYADTGET